MNHTSASTSTEGWYSLQTSWTHFGVPMAPIAGQSALEFGIEWPEFHEARRLLGISWRVFRRDWNRLVAGERDRRRIRTIRRVARQAGRCIFTEKWDFPTLTLTCV